jgi:hypothetical protein
MNRTTTIASSEIYKDYERAFSEATQLPLALRPVEVWRFALEGKRYENPFLRNARKVQSHMRCLFG